MRPTPIAHARVERANPAEWLRDRAAQLHDLAARLVEQIGDDRHYPLRTATALLAGLGVLAVLCLGAAEVLR